MKLSIDIETYSGADLRKTGVYPYVEDPDFTILLMAYAYDDEPVQIVDMTDPFNSPVFEVMKDINNPDVKLHAFDAQFERVCINRWLHNMNLSRIGYQGDLGPERWHCTMIKAWMAGYAGGLGTVAKMMNLPTDKQKDRRGTALINYFCKPCKPTKANGGRTRNLPHHAPVKWAEFKEYCKQDVVAERAISDAIGDFPISDTERKLYVLDQQINDRGVLMDGELVGHALRCGEQSKDAMMAEAKEITGISNPNSPAQLRAWIEEVDGVEVGSLDKDHLPGVMAELKSEKTLRMLAIRQETNKTSTKKYAAMANCTRADGRVGGLLQHYGAARTGRWAGRLVQVQNLPKNKMKQLDDARRFLKAGNYAALDMLYGNVQDTLSQLVRTAFIAPPGKTFVVADFSAIEARVIAWLAGETWRQEVFATHGKIYEASASAMFNVPLDEITKDSPLRQKGKVAELALGYGGSVGALKAMGALAMGLEEHELKPLVDAWRKSNPAIVKLWRALEDMVEIRLDRLKPYEKTYSLKNVAAFTRAGKLHIELPNGRLLSYADAQMRHGKFGRPAITYKGLEQQSRRITRLETYGGKLTENVVQAIARDCLAEAMLRLDAAGYPIVMHVHDEVIIEVGKEAADTFLADVCEIMGLPIDWAPGLLLRADGYTTDYYLKD